MPNELNNKTALVCGSSQGIGLAIAKELAQKGAHIILLSRNEDKLKKALSQLDVSSNQSHHYIVADTQFSEATSQKVANFIGENQTIHILINNTGGPPSLPIIETSAEDLIKAFHSHLITGHLLTQTVVPGMKRAKFGRIVNILSTSVKEPMLHLGISNSIRAAVANWAKTLSKELALYGITVNNVLPGAIHTERSEYLFQKQIENTGRSIEEVRQQTKAQIPVGRMGKPEELAYAVAFLCLPQAAYINGISLPVDGGKMASS